MALQVRRLSNTLGAEIIELDMARPLDAAGVTEVRQAFLTYGILLFRNQAITPAQHIAFSRHFGELDQHETLPRDRHPEYPELLMVTNRPKGSGAPSDSRYTGRKWHSDMSFTLHPSMASLLHGRELPEVGGDTLFANMTAAYDALSGTMKSVIESLHGVHTMGRVIPDATPDRIRLDRELNPPISQPLVRIHGETGRKALYIGEKVELIEGMSRDESQPLIDFLCGHAQRHEFTYRHQWRKNDVLMWDNRCTMHIALADFDQSQLRELFRTTIVGEPSGHPYQASLT